MAKPQIEIRSEYSAQRRSHPTNSSLREALNLLDQRPEFSKSFGRVADLGCGKLRHFALLSRADELYLVDTDRQLRKQHSDSGNTYTVIEVAAAARKEGRRVFVETAEKFAVAQLRLDLVVCVAVLDVVPPATRRTIVKSASRNLRAGGSCVIVAPRNDSTILRRCTAQNTYQDGHVFANHGSYTFFHNFRDHRGLVRLCSANQLELVEDLSIYRQVCLILRKKKL